MYGSILKKFLTNKDFKVSSYGLFEEAERRMISFNNRYEIPFPLKKIKIVTTSKFNMISHKDYLGCNTSTWNKKK